MDIYEQEKQNDGEFFSNLGLFLVLAVVGLIFISPVLAVILAIYWTFTGAFSAALGALWYLVLYLFLGWLIKAIIRDFR